MEERLESFLDRIGESITRHWFKIRDVQEWMLEEVFRKFRTFPRWRKKVLFSWTVFKKNLNIEDENNNNSDNIRKGKESEEKKDGNQKKSKKDSANSSSSSSDPANQDQYLLYIPEFFKKKYHELFSYFFDKMFPFDSKRLKLVIEDEKTNYPASEVFFEYKYYFTKEEIEIVKEFKKRFNHPETYKKILTYLFNIIIMTFKKLLGDIIDKKVQVRMLAGRIKTSEKLKQPLIKEMELKEEDLEDLQYLHFLTVVRLLDFDFYQLYLKSEIFHFAEKIPQTPEHFLKQLRNNKNALYPMALENYKNGLDMTSTVLYNLSYKSKIIEEFTPLLDITNFICSRVEDSVFNSDELVENIISQNISQDPNIIDPLTKLFRFLNQNASLFSTFQSNNRANKQNQYQLFFFYSQYFCRGGFNDLGTNPVFFPEILKDTIKKTPLVKNDVNDFYYSIFHGFVFQGLVLLDKEGFDQFFNSLFQKSVFALNEMFFDTFLYSFNKKFKQKIKKYRSQYSEFNYSLNEIIDLLSEILLEFVNSVFIAENPEEATKNFHDSLSRYTPSRLALRLLELKIFKNIPLSDNNWQDYFLSRNKEYVKEIFKPFFEIPNDWFFSEKRLLKINMIYERGAIEKTPYLENWLINDVVAPFYEFQKTVRDQLGDQFTTTELGTIVFEEISKNIIDPVVRDKMEDISMFIANFI